MGWLVCAKKRWFLWVLVSIYLGLSLVSWQSFRDQEDTVLSSHLHGQQKELLRNPLEELSSVDYWACCGLGHRLIRMSLAHYVAKQRNFSLRAFWGWCGEQAPIEVFSYLFRPYKSSEVQGISRGNVLLPFYNEVPGFSALVRTPTNNRSECACQRDKVDADFELYSSLRDRFRSKHIVDKFVREQFDNATVIGVRFDSMRRLP